MNSLPTPEGGEGLDGGNYPMVILSLGNAFYLLYREVLCEHRTMSIEAPSKPFREIGPCDKKYMEAAEAFSYTMRGDSSSFSADLFRLIMRADRENFIRLSCVYPYEAKVVWDWRDCETSNGYFEKLGLK